VSSRAGNVLVGGQSSRIGSGKVLLPPEPGGLLNPLGAICHRNARQVPSRNFERGIRKVAAALKNMQMVTFSMPDAAFFQNVDTPEGWTRYAGR
jgi:molybdopterin-guanine dinucleotide biosynthesis protein A